MTGRRFSVCDGSLVETIVKALEAAGNGAVNIRAGNAGNGVKNGGNPCGQRGQHTYAVLRTWAWPSRAATPERSGVRAP